MDNAKDSRRARGEATKQALLRATEQLVAEHGVENISIRRIVAKAGQKNESALQYHFKNLTGLLQALHDERSQQVRALRGEMLTELLARSPQPDLRELCLLMIEPGFQLARRSAAFRRYIKTFGHMLAVSDSSPLKQASLHGGGGASGAQIKQQLSAILPHLDDEAYTVRMNAAIMLSSASMHHHARRRNAFRGAHSDVFLHNLADALVGLLGAPISAKTKSALKQAAAATDASG